MQVFFERALKESPNGDLRQYVRVIVCLETLRLILKGVARSYYGKQIAQNACLELARYYDLQIANNIQVERA